MKRTFKKGEKVFSLSMRRPAVVIEHLADVEEPRMYSVRSTDEYGVSHEAEEWVYDLIPLQGDCCAKRNRELVRQLEKIIRKLEG